MSKTLIGFLILFSLFALFFLVLALAIGAFRAFLFIFGTILIALIIRFAINLILQGE